MFVLSWVRARGVALWSVVTERCTLSGMVLVSLLLFQLLMYVLMYGGVYVFHSCFDL